MEKYKKNQAILAESQQIEATLGIYGIFGRFIDDYGPRSGWDSATIATCKRQFQDWIMTPIESMPGSSYVDTNSVPRFWTAMASSRQWEVLGDFASKMLSIPITEAEDERIFSMKRHIIGKQARRSKTDLLTARVRTRVRRRQTQRSEAKLKPKRTRKEKT
jgi:hypothetical protein